MQLMISFVFASCLFALKRTDTKIERGGPARCPSLASYRTDKRDRTDGPQLKPRMEYLDDRDDHDLTPRPS
jgi:hypothetical protein